MPTLYVQQKKKNNHNTAPSKVVTIKFGKQAKCFSPPMLYKKEKEINTLFEKCLCFLNNLIWQLYSRAAQIHPVLDSPEFISGPQF